MRRLLLVLVLVIVAVSVTVEAWSSGPPASNVVSGDGCTCHSTNPNSGTAVTVQAPSSYAVGQSYTIKVTSTTDVTSVGINKGGFLSWASAGTLEKPSTNANWYQTEQLDGKWVIKHTTAGDQGNANQAWEYTWKAPATHAGSVQIKVWVNRVNGDGGASDADHWNRKHVTIAAPATTAPTSSPTSPGQATSSPSKPGASSGPGSSAPVDGVPALPAVAVVAVLAVFAATRPRR